MIPRVLRQFFGRLFRTTNEGRLHWKAASESSYFCVHNGTTITISYHFDHDREVASYHLYIVTEGGEETAFSCSQYEADDYEDMRSLFEAASASAFAPDTSLGNFFDGL